MSDPRCRVEIQVKRDDDPFPWAVFYWPVVPRVGELVTLREAGKRFESKVVSVVWGEPEGATKGLDSVLVYLYVEGQLNKEK